MVKTKNNYPTKLYEYGGKNTIFFGGVEKNSNFINKCEILYIETSTLLETQLIMMDTHTIRREDKHKDNLRRCMSKMVS